MRTLFLYNLRFCYYGHQSIILTIFRCILAVQYLAITRISTIFSTLYHIISHHFHSDLLRYGHVSSCPRDRTIIIHRNIESFLRVSFCEQIVCNCSLELAPNETQYPDSPMFKARQQNAFSLFPYHSVLNCLHSFGSPFGSTEKPESSVNPINPLVIPAQYPQRPKSTRMQNPLRLIISSQVRQ